MVPGRVCPGTGSSLYRAKMWAPARAEPAGCAEEKMAMPQPHPSGSAAWSKLPTLSEPSRPSETVMRIACTDLCGSSKRGPGTQELSHTWSPLPFPESPPHLLPFDLHPSPPGPVPPAHHLSKALKPGHTVCRLEKPALKSPLGSPLCEPPPASWEREAPVSPGVSLSLG